MQEPPDSSRTSEEFFYKKNMNSLFFSTTYPQYKPKYQTNVSTVCSTNTSEQVVMDPNIRDHLSV